MIKKYIALCFIIINSVIIHAAEENPAETTFIISSKKTAWFQSLEKRFNIVLNRQQEEHTAQQQKMRLDHEENIKKLSQIFVARVQENDVIFTKQLDDNQKKNEEQTKNIQKVLSSSTQYKHVELDLKNNKAKLVCDEKKLAIHQVHFNDITITTHQTLAAIAVLAELCSMAAGYKAGSWKLTTSLTLYNGIVFGCAYYATDTSALEEKIKNRKEYIKELEKILNPAPVSENIKLETENSNNNGEETHD